MIPLFMDELAELASREADKLGFTTACDRGHVLQRERLAAIAHRCCEAMPGDIIELGCYAGVTSAALAEVARRHKRRLICIDDFKNRKGFDHTDAAKSFIRVHQQNEDVMDWLCLDAHSLAAVKEIQKRRYCFAFADAGHDYHEALCELIVLMECTDGIVVKDDFYLPHMPAVVDHALRLFEAYDGNDFSIPWELMCDSRLAEAYLQRR